MNNKIINKEPQKKRGFNQFLSSSNSTNNEQILKYISNKIKNLKISTKDSKIISKIINSYKKKIEGTQLNQYDYILKNQELLELQDKKGFNLIRYLVYRYKFNTFPNLKIIDDYPLNLQIEVSSVCNLRCVMCYQKDKTFSSKSKGFMGYMNFELFKHIPT